LRKIEESNQYAAIANNVSIIIGKKPNDRLIKLAAIIPPQ
jgi:hypothetical protein